MNGFNLDLESDHFKYAIVLSNMSVLVNKYSTQISLMMILLLLFCLGQPFLVAVNIIIIIMLYYYYYYDIVYTINKIIKKDIYVLNND